MQVAEQSRPVMEPSRYTSTPAGMCASLSHAMETFCSRALACSLRYDGTDLACSTVARRESTACFVAPLTPSRFRKLTAVQDDRPSNSGCLSIGRQR